MGEVVEQRPVLLLVAVTSRHKSAFTWALEKAQQRWGEVELASPIYDFTETSYYAESMGEDLKKQFLTFKKLIDPAMLAETKLTSNLWEDEFRDENDFPEERPINLDPGYITEAKLILATTKDRDHRIYLQQGIFAEITLFFRSGGWQGSRWTYPDYQRDDFQEFFSNCRTRLRELYRA